MNKKLLTIAVCAGLAACETTNGPPPPPAPPPNAAQPVFRAADFAWSTQRGAASIRGVVDYGQGYSCAGQPVVLVPDAPFSRWRISQFYGSDDHAALPVADVRSRQAHRPSDDYSAFSKHTVCDGLGHFAFQGLPAGSWFVIAVARSMNGQGQDMAIMRRVDIHPGVVKAVDLD